MKPLDFGFEINRDYTDTDYIEIKKISLSKIETTESKTPETKIFLKIEDLLRVY